MLVSPVGMNEISIDPFGVCCGHVRDRSVRVCLNIGSMEPCGKTKEMTGKLKKEI